jgi:hypothetical protein
MATAVQVTHKCGHVLGVFNAPDDHGSIEMLCPKCKDWVEIFMQTLMFPEDVQPGGVNECWLAEQGHGLSYEDVSEQYPTPTEEG